MMSVILLQAVAISKERSTDRPCARDMYNTARSCTHESNTCVIRRLAFLNLGFIDLLSCTRSLPPSTTSHQTIMVCPRTSESWDCLERSWGFLYDRAAVRRLCNRCCSTKSTKNKNYSIEVSTSKVRVWTFGLSPVIRLGIRHPRKKGKKRNRIIWK